jgi:hypothetical protein
MRRVVIAVTFLVGFASGFLSDREAPRQFAHAARNAPRAASADKALLGVSLFAKQHAGKPTGTGVSNGYVWRAAWILAFSPGAHGKRHFRL